jgi:hypothetical protein
MSKDNSDYKKSLQQDNHTVKVTDTTGSRNMAGNTSGSGDDSKKKGGSKKKNK